MTDLTIVSWKWKTGLPNRELYDHNDVNRLDRGLRRFVTRPFRHICITDDSQGINPEVEIFPLWDNLSEYGGCFRRLYLFAHPSFTGRVVSIDLDCVIVDQLDPLFEREEDLVLWQSRTSKALYNGSMFMFDAGEQHHDIGS